MKDQGDVICTFVAMTTDATAGEHDFLSDSVSSEMTSLQLVTFSRSQLFVLHPPNPKTTDG